VALKKECPVSWWRRASRRRKEIMASIVLPNECLNDKPHKWSKWDFLAYCEEGGTMEERRCKRCGKRQHKKVEIIK